jgi:hypothetical protein
MTRRPLELRERTGYHDLMADLRKAGCPACHGAHRSAWRYIDGLLWESVNDPGTRARLRASLGFCREHSLMAISVASAQSASLGMAILYEDLLRSAGRALAREARERSKRARGRRAVSRPRCPACDSAEGHAANYLTILAVSDPDSEPGRAIGRHGHGLCLPHAMQGIAAAHTPAERDRLVEVFLRGADELRGELAEYARKTDYRFHHEGMSEAEASAWRRAVLRLVGEVRPRRRPER